MSIKQQFRTTMKKVNGDLLTPILIFSRLQGERKFLLESSSKNDNTGRYSFIGANPRKTYSGSETTLVEHSRLTNKTYHYEGDLIQSLKQVMPRISNHTEYPFTGGAIGYIRYGATQLASAQKQDVLNLPTVNFHVYDTMIIFDHMTDELIIFHTNIEAEQKEPNLDELIEQLLNGKPAETTDYTLSEFRLQQTDELFDQQVTELQQAATIQQGGQVVLSRRFDADFDGDAFALYRKLRVENPAAYMYYIAFDDHTIVGSSPESLLSVNNGVVSTKLVAGSRPRGTSTTDDIEIELALLGDKDEIAHHNTLIDIATADLQQITVPDSVEVTNYLTTIRSQHLMQLLSEIEGQLSPTLHAIDALVHCLPAGSVTGSPKQQAIELIDQLETVHRSFYGGALGYIGFNGQIDFTLISRTILIQEKLATIQSGTFINAQTNVKDATQQILMKSESLCALAKG